MKALSETGTMRRSFYGPCWQLKQIARDALPGTLAALALILIYALVGAIES